MNPYEAFGTNKEFESGKGVKLEYPGFSITIHRAGGSNKKFATVLAAKMKPHRHKFDRGLLDDETANRILREAYAEAVVVDWEGVTDPAGKKIKFSVAACTKLFDDLPDLFEDVKAQAANLANFREQAEQAEEKN